MLDEKSFRRPDFLPGTWVRMADGQVWSLPEVPGRSPSGMAEDGTSPGAEGAALGRDYEATVAVVLDAEDQAEQIRAELALAIVLLASNYHLEPADYQELLGGESDSPVVAAMQRAFHIVALEHARHFRPRTDAGLVPRTGAGSCCLGHLWAWGR